MKAQSGFGLIEVMVALTIGIVLLLGLASVFASMRRTSVASQQLSLVQNQQRIALYFLHTAVAGAGYYNAMDNGTPPQQLDPIALFPATSAQPLFSGAGQSLAGVGKGTGTDSLSVRFMASATAGLQGCSANLTAGDIYTDTFSVSAGVLQCVETHAPAAQPGNASAPNTVRLIPGLVSMNIRYGVDQTGAGSVTTYLRADDVQATNFWPLPLTKGAIGGRLGVSGVKTVEVTLVFQNPLASDAGQAPTVQLMETIPYMANV